MRSLCSILFAGLAAFTLTLSGAAPADEKKAEAPPIKEGDKVPDIKLEATQIDKIFPDKKGTKTLSLKDFEGKKNVVLFFYPAAMTPGCTVESCGFTKVYDDFAKLDTVVIGISTDTLDKQLQFTEKEKLTTPLLADPEKKATAAFGALNTTGRAKRFTFVIDKKGVVRKIYTTVKPADHPEEVMKFVKDNLK